MIAYKFRGQEDMMYALDIIMNRRLYCAPWSDLNDPIEGAFRAFVLSQHDDRLIQTLQDQKNQIRICSLSRTHDSHLLWSHYASGFRGLAIELSLPELESSERCPAIRQVEYRQELYPKLQSFEPDYIEGEAMRLLSSKYKEWQYEQEVRILNKEVFYQHRELQVLSVTAGHRMSRTNLDCLTTICQQYSVPLRKERLSIAV